MKEIFKMKYPTYVNEFKCVGGKCEDNCCNSWGIHIDKITFKQYENVQDKKMNRYLNKNIFY